jgi:hypothetical protein
VYLHDMPRPEPTIPDRQLSNDSVYLWTGTTEVQEFLWRWRWCG